MPTVDRVDGLRLVIYPNDHRPAQVHVMDKGGEAVFNLHCPDGPLELRENYGLSRRACTKIKTALTRKLAHLCAACSTIHGNP